MKLTLRQLHAACKLGDRGGAVWHKVGTGKTRITYKWFATIAKAEKKRGYPCTFLVVCRREAFGDWQEESNKCGLGWEIQSIESNDDFGNILSPSANCVYLISHGMLAKALDGLIDYASYIDGIAFDEGYLYKNPTTKHCKAANKLAKSVGRASILSGSMMTARNLSDIYGQLYAINRHEVLGRTFTEFRSTYQHELRIGNSGGRRYASRRGAAQKIARAIRGCSTIYFPTNNQRRVVEIPRTLPASEAQTDAFTKLKEEYWLRLKGKELEIRNAPSLIIKCQQISDGFIQMHGKTESGTDKSKGLITVPSLKLSYLISQVEELLTCGEKIVIWCAFRESVRLVLQALQKAFPEVGVFAFVGGQKFNRDGWNKNGRICVGTEASGSSVNFLKDCSYAIYYSMGFGWRDLQQSQGRTNRHDSLHSTCYYYFLHTKGSMDSHVYNIVRASSLEEKNLILLGAAQQWLTIKQ